MSSRDDLRAFLDKALIEGRTVATMPSHKDAVALRMTAYAMMRKERKENLSAKLGDSCAYDDLTLSVDANTLTAVIKPKFQL